MRKRFLVVLTVFVLLLTGCGQSNSNNDTFVVGMECGYAPYNWTDPSKTDSNVEIDGGQYCDGYDVQIAKRLATQMGKDLVIKKMVWEGLILSLQTNQIDAIIAGMSPTDERKKEINFSDVYFRDDVAFGIVVTADSSYANGTTVDDFADARVAAQIGTFHMDLLKQLKDVNPVENFKDFANMTMALEYGEIDGFVADSGTGDMIKASNPKLKYIQLNYEITDAMSGVGVGVSKDNPELLEDINEALKTIPVEEQRKLMDTAVNSGNFVDTHFFGQVWNILENNWQSFARGTGTTLLVSMLATFFGFLIALFVAVTRGTKVTNVIANIYVTVFRGTPMMVQAMIFYYGTLFLFPGFRWANLPLGNLLAGIIVVSINTGAYLSETLRSGIQAIDKGQFEAAKALGYTNRQTMMKIILPQAIKNVIPALGNELIVNVKDTSVLNIIQVTELFFVSNGIASTTYQILQTFTITTSIYLVLTIILTAILRIVELKLDKTKTQASSYPASITNHNNLA